MLRGSYLKQNIGDNVGIFLQNKRKLSLIVAFCRPCSCKWRILAILKVLRSAFTLYYSQVNAERKTFKIVNMRYLQLQGQQNTTIIYINITPKILLHKIRTS